MRIKFYKNRNIAKKKCFIILGILEYTASRRGKLHILFNGYRYIINRKTKTSEYWNCVYTKSKYNCRAKLIVVGNRVKTSNGTHKCNKK